MSDHATFRKLLHIKLNKVALILGWKNFLQWNSWAIFSRPVFQCYCAMVRFAFDGGKFQGGKLFACYVRNVYIKCFVITLNVDPAMVAWR